MKQIVIHIGDRVHHKTLGDGVVIAVHENYGTARFGDKEANFLIPESFVRGFITSEDARFGSEDETDIKKTENDQALKRNKLGWLEWLLVIGVPARYILPFIIVFLIIYLATESTLFLILTILGVLMFVYFVVYGIKKFKEPLPPSKHYSESAVPSSETDSDSDSDSVTAGLIFGAGLFGHYLGKHHKSHAEKVSDDWLWQEKYRRHDDYYDGENW